MMNIENMNTRPSEPGYQKGKQMADDRQTLIQSLCDTALILSGIDQGNSELDDQSVDIPHVEMIDFDKLRDLLTASMAALEHARENDRDIAVARNWLANRVQSLQRGRNAVVSAHNRNNGVQSPDQSTLSELITQYEESAARLRRLVSTNCRQTIGKSDSGRGSFQEFKS
jgi:hypothetical protein